MGESAAAADAVVMAGEAPESKAPPAPPAKDPKKAKPEPEVKQLSLF